MKLNQKPLLIFTDREDGNIAFHVGDDINSVLSNHEILALKHNYDLSSLVHMKQIHSNIVHEVEEGDSFENPPTCDALITNKKNIPLMVMVADCSPIVFYDRKKHAIAVAHSGRAGAFKNISKNVIEKFAILYNSDITDIEVTVGPAIGPCCYEVGLEIVEEAEKLGLEYAIQQKENNYYLDIPAILKTQFDEFGIKNYTISNTCTCCNTHKFFSYRAEGNTGRFGAVVEL
ncbi:peptidoglycan editing factor PgeF [Sulfurimonas sp. C5]|uniref:peptidoglycan editing factor PgeF n=1 Tax=Sulfurimonas sp. C5 TaxID=3036947 RepID=UPI0024589AF6|nr:peptidoglycan editing factor PgeF [Sulfurimonas sp. C5]MDH4945136.1 peptidoglycan editing factor PgeF [Sulfurimonas sp. C5]